VASVAPTVGVIGMKALRRDITKLSADAGPLNKALADAGRIAAQPVAAAVRESVPRDTGTLAGDVRVLASRTGASVRMGRASVPYAGPVDFGGWPEGRDFIPTGRYMYPAATPLAETAATDYANGAQRALDAFPWSNETNNAEAVHD
jgi:hypothetical protein